ncbi:uncharacterized protein Z519_08272 [Cladophialophora bantiana CBS 173.52]|uniref:methionyl-tRNA formyltransferase n=1 Tax=Cladophialophora bantiana (strain ATCC 10958 / CBS 173.52 / CDC B-1940 / NIH 8579) TaxID=1442370 RepID=A0A0D2EMY9_CLAB1|nr:uncharacterized protein Z519_08272 [Cladophialophora bantiana CBS 173.52]KIW91376.1 hypothetical protein Z519_08272 [Cladophialophora bantiana CBS 173.52]
MRRLPFRLGTCSPARACASKRSPGKSDWQRRHFSSLKSESDDPLRILFCGTDRFSVASLEALDRYSKTPESNILSIDVVTKTDKRVGRGRKLVKPPAIKTAAQDLGLPIHQIDTFTGWSPPVFSDADDRSCNLIVAVSFGLLIPPRILQTAKYGGLNVHPSMLPDLRGPAPIQWAIITGRRRTGVSLQTLHPTRFDEGIVLDQTARPGLDIPEPDQITAEELTSYLAPIGAKMLVDAIRNRLYIPPYNAIQLSSVPGAELTHAPKVTNDICAIDFEALTKSEVLRRNRALQSLHSFARLGSEQNQVFRINFGADMRDMRDGDIPEEVRAVAGSIPAGVPYAIVAAHENVNESSEPLIVNALSDENGENCHVVIPTITVSSRAKGPGAGAAARAKFFSMPAVFGQYKLYRFSHPVSGIPGHSWK